VTKCATVNGFGGARYEAAIVHFSPGGNYSGSSGPALAPY